MPDVVVVGTGGLAREIACLVRTLHAQGICGAFRGYVGEGPEEVRMPYGPVLGTDTSFLETLSGSDAVDVAIGVGYPGARRKIAERYGKHPSVSFPNFIHPSVEFADETPLGVGNVFFSGGYVSCQVRIGSFNFFNWKVTLGHDVAVGNACVVNPGAHVSGFVELGDTCLIGSGAVIVERNRIGSGVSIGAGAVVTKDILEPGTYVGVPAGPLVRTSAR